MRLKTHKFFNTATRQAMFEKVKGYVDKAHDPDAEIEQILRDTGLPRVYRFDLGENAEGYSPRIQAYLSELRKDGTIDARLNDWLNVYPDRTHTQLRQRLGEKFSLPPEWILVGAGLDSILDLITRVFLDHRDFYVTPIPSFYLFEEYSERMGAIPYFLELDEAEGFRWTARTTQQFKRLVETFRPKLAWIANPNNPTGQHIHEAVLEDLIAFANTYNTFIVIDEAYGEYTDPPSGVHSAATFLHRYENLMVLRTFSKKYGLASLRIGYLMCASQDIHEGLQLHRHHFPVTQLSADLALIALEDEAFLDQSRAQNEANRREVFERLAALETFATVPSQSNIFMLRNRRLEGPALKEALARRGIVTSPLEISGLRDKGYLRLTLRNREDNRILCEACEAIDRDVVSGARPSTGGYIRPANIAALGT